MCWVVGKLQYFLLLLHPFSQKENVFHSPLICYQPFKPRDHVFTNFTIIYEAFIIY